MSDHNNSKMCSQTTKQNDVLFNLLALKNRLLLTPQECDNCHTNTEEWAIIGTCHHKMCRNCTNTPMFCKKICPKCKTKFDPKINLSTTSEMKKTYCEMEQLVWHIMALENGTLPEMKEFLREESNSNKSSKIVNANLSAETSQDNQNSELLSDSNHRVSHLSTDMVQEMQLSEKASSKGRSQDLSLVQLNSAENEEMSRDLDQTNHLSDEPRADSDRSKSEDDIIEGTPVKCHALNLVSSVLDGIVQNSEKIVLSHSSLNSEDIKILADFVDFFNVEVVSSWDDSVTHLVVKTVDGNTCFRTKKYFSALLSHCCIVSLDWIKDSLSCKCLMPEVDYMPLDSSKQPAALASWKVGLGLIESPMEWTKDCILLFHSSVEQSNDSYLDIIALVKKAGFVLANHIKELDDKFKMKVIVFDSPCNDLTEDVKSWEVEQALLLNLEWLLECLAQYRFVPMSSEYHFK